MWRQNRLQVVGCGASTYPELDDVAYCYLRGEAGAGSGRARRACSDNTEVMGLGSKTLPGKNKYTQPQPAAPHLQEWGEAVRATQPTLDENMSGTLVRDVSTSVTHYTQTDTIVTRNETKWHAFSFHAQTNCVTTDRVDVSGRFWAVGTNRRVVREFSSDWKEKEKYNIPMVNRKREEYCSEGFELGEVLTRRRQIGPRVPPLPPTVPPVVQRPATSNAVSRNQPGVARHLASLAEPSSSRPRLKNYPSCCISPGNIKPAGLPPPSGPWEN
ncbi:hypothetical protein J6590_063683 [Homalodisca vitripennis]|nr:hypothetical protein J6590_063683 [Homalodisca vitripennis]